MKPGCVYFFKRFTNYGVEEALFVALTSWDVGDRRGRRARGRVMMLWSNKPYRKPGNVVEISQNDELWRLSEKFA